MNIISMKVLLLALSPALTHAAVTLNDLTTVRSYQKQGILREEFDHLQDIQTACSFMIVSTTSTFGFSLDVLCTLFIAFITLYYTISDTGASAEVIGLSISQAIFMTGLLSWGELSKLHSFIHSFHYKHPRNLYA